MFASFFVNFVQAEDISNFTCAVYFTGVGCTHCAKTDPVILEDLPKEYPNFVVIEYEIYQQKENALLLDEYCEKYNLPYCQPGGPVPCCGIPLVIFSQSHDEIITGGKAILGSIREKIEVLDSNKCFLVDGTSVNFNKLDVNSLPGKPKIWTSQGSFSKEETAASQLSKKELTLPKIVSLAVVDAVNPCALAVLILMLIAILTYNPTKRRNVLLAGLAFVISVFVMYLIYGLIIVKSFQFVQSLTFTKLWLYKILGAGAIILGCFKLRDFFRYKAVCKVSPRVDRIISKITSPRGAFLVGAFVTIFLLPCTIGPYIICGGILCPFGMLKSLLWLLLYNSIFILPMLVVVLIIYFGLSKVQDIVGWQAKNIKYLNLISGLIILGLGIAIVLGLV